MKKILPIILIISNLIFAAVPEQDGEAPEPNYSLMFPTEEEQDPNVDMVGDDSLNQELIEYGIGYESEVGESYLKKQIDESGKIYYIDIRTNEKIYNFPEKNISEEYKSSIQGIDGGTPTTDEEKAVKALSIKNAKEARKTELLNKDYTPKQYENLFLHNLEVSGRGSSIVNSYFINPNNLENDTTKTETQQYIDNYGYGQASNSIETFKSQNADSKLAQGYALVDQLKAGLTAKYSNKSIQCYISRELVPKYYCPLIGKENTLYAGDEKTSSGTGLSTCNSNCKDSKTCISYKVLEDLDIKLTEEDKTLNLYPSWDSNNNYIKSNKIDDVMMVDTISFDIEIKPSSEWEGTPEEFEKFLETNNIKFRFSLIKKEETLNNPSELLVDGEIITLKSSLTKKTLNISNISEYFVLMFYKPYIYEDYVKATLKDPEILKMIESIEVKNLKGFYKSKDLYFCPFRQLINQTKECNLDQGKMITLMSGSQVLNICTDAEHKIGPDRKYGAFYTEESCELNCVESDECLPTYKHYSDFNTDDIFKARVDCVDSPENSSCSKEKCEELLADNNLLPTNEWVTYNDDLKKQTVENKVINKSITRPKFNLGDELSVSTSYTELFQSEMKDAAYKYMLDNGTYNRITYRIGEESPRKMSYYTEFISSKQQLLWNLKPASFDIDNEQDYNLYVILELDQLYQPIAGVFMIDGQQVQANKDDSNGLQFLDKTYMIRTNSSTDWWKIFKKIEFTNMKKVYDIKRCTDGTYESNVPGYFDNQILPENCSVSQKIIWPETPYLNINRNVFYNSSTDTFATYDANTEIAEKFLTQKFSSDVVENTYLISSFLQLELEEAPGGLIRNQESLNHDMSFRKIYNSGFEGTKVRGWPYNYRIYAFYAKENLTYQDIISDYLIESNVIYDKVNKENYPKKIKHDGDINNHIKPFILGNKDITTINMEVEPYLQEEGQKVFKFLFLYDDVDGTNPFAGYEIQGN